MLKEFNKSVEVSKGTVQGALVSVRDGLLTVVCFPFYLPALVVGFLAGLLKLIAGAIVTGFRHGFRSIGNG